MGNRKNLPQHGNLKTKPPTQHAKRFYRKKFAPPQFEIWTGAEA
jgi:hypothetical protein